MQGQQSNQAGGGPLWGLGPRYFLCTALSLLLSERSAYISVKGSRLERFTKLSPSDINMKCFLVFREKVQAALFDIYALRANAHPELCWGQDRSSRIVPQIRPGYKLI